MPIEKLPLLLINQIAAGEVIERPASVVKELVENSLDAGATRLDIAIEDGGKQLIRISDDGHGIPENELLLAIAPHATSKLQTPEQLASIGTLGFRGEAIASIASISRLRMITRAMLNGQLAENGAMLEAQGDQVVGPVPAACAAGTIVEIRDLFFNTPARRKFLRGAPTEFGQISDLVTRIALVHPHVAFKLTHNGRKVIDVPETQNHRQRCLDLLGKELDEVFLEFSHCEDTHVEHELNASVWGLAALPTIAKATSKFQYLCVNGRPIKDRSLSHAIKEAYRGLMPPDRHPMVVLFIRVDPAALDVNVHPTKAEVRFCEPGKMHSLILHALRQRLLSTDLTASATIPPASSWTHSSNNSSNHLSSQMGQLADQTTDQPMPTMPPSQALPTADSDPFKPPIHFQASPQPHSPNHASSSAPTSTPASSTDAFVRYFKQMAPQQKGFIYQQVKQAMAESDPETDSCQSEVGDHDQGKSQADNQGKYLAWDQAVAQSSQGQTPSSILQEKGVLQVHRSYLVTQDEQGIVIVDQHALHERVMFEELKQRILSRQLESQRLLMPAVLPASAKRIDLLDQLQPLMQKIGIEASAIGPKSIGVHSFPTLLFDRKVDPAEFVDEILDRAEEGEMELTNPNVEEAALHEVLDMMACKAAVKAGDSLTDQELAALLAKRTEIERASNCPHGRPTTVRLTLRDLEKFFHRT